MTRWWRTVRSVSPWRQTCGVHAPALLHCPCILSCPEGQKSKVLPASWVAVCLRETPCPLRALVCLSAKQRYLRTALTWTFYGMATSKSKPGHRPRLIVPILPALVHLSTQVGNSMSRRGSTQYVSIDGSLVLRPDPSVSWHISI